MDISAPCQPALHLKFESVVNSEKRISRFLHYNKDLQHLLAGYFLYPYGKNLAQSLALLIVSRTPALRIYFLVVGLSPLVTPSSIDRLVPGESQGLALPRR